MTAHLLTLNAGSSSVKFALFPAEPGAEVPRLLGVVDGLGPGLQSRIRIRGADGAALHESALRGPTHADALAGVLDALAREAADARIVAVGHRIVHGGTRFDGPVRIDHEVLQALAALQSLAPLHQPHNLAGVRAAMAAFDGVAQVACFDTAFHRSQPAVHQRFALPARLHEAGVRRYGFHGLSYESICDQLDGAPGRVVVAHLGNGASVCAIRDGRSVATTMSFSPLDGLPMGTRCGRLDAAVVLHLIQHHGMSARDVTALLFRESGLLGLSGVSSDMRTLESSGAPEAAMAIDYFVEQALQGLAQMTAALRGIDALVFTGGIGENAAALRERMVVGSEWMGLVLDPTANQQGSRVISAPASRVKIMVVPTNEEAMIARHTALQVGLKSGTS